MPSPLTLALFCALTGTVAAQCGKSDHPNCAAWNRNVKFCTDTARPLEMRQKYCPVTCGNLNCPKPGAPNATTTTAKPGTGGAENKNCAAWAADPAKPFCVGTTMTVAQKTLFCPTTCAFEIKPTDDCALYTVTDKKLTRGTPVKRENPEKGMPSGAVDKKTTLAQAYAADKCTVKLFAANPPDLKAPTVSFLGTADKNFFPILDANNGALSYSCTCV